MQRGERGGGTTAAAVVLGCALIGAVAGYATSYASHQEPAEGPSAVPLAATSPSVPTNPPVHVVPDSNEYPPLDTDLTYVTRFIRQASARWQYDAPSGWERHETSSGVRWTLPENPKHTYSVRVVPVSVPITTRNLARYRFHAVRDSPELEAVELKSIDEHSVTFTYVVDQHLDLPTLVLDLEAGLGDRRLRDHGVGPVARRSPGSRRCLTTCWRRQARSPDARPLSSAHDPSALTCRAWRCCRGRCLRSRGRRYGPVPTAGGWSSPG